MRTSFLTTTATLLLLTTGTVRAEPPATQPAKSPAPEWVKLNADEAWYKDCKNPEHVFTGMLMRHNEPEATTQDRPRCYRLGECLLYPGKKRPELDRLLYKNVEIRGKLCDLSLEGLSVTEIWPAAIRLSPTPTTRPATRPIHFDPRNGYFVSNKFEPNAPVSFVVIRDQKAFDEVFGTAMVIYDRSHRMPADVFVSKIVLAVIKRGHTVWQYRVTDVIEKAGTLTLRYTAAPEKQDSAAFACPCIVTVPADIYPVVRFEENGLLVKTIELTWAEVKQAAGQDAEKADAELNKVYKRLMAVLDKDERKRLVAAQQAWIVFRDTECQFEANYTGNGTDILVNYPCVAQQMAKARTAELRRVLDERDR